MIFLISQYSSFRMKPLPGIMPSTMGPVVTLPAIVPLTIKQDDGKLHNRFSFLDH